MDDYRELAGQGDVGFASVAAVHCHLRELSWAAFIPTYLAAQQKKSGALRLMFNHERPHVDLQNDASAAVIGESVGPCERKYRCISVGISDLATS